MERIQPYFKLNKRKKELEIWVPKARLPKIYSLEDEDIENVERLIQRDFKTAILYRRSNNEGIAELAIDIIEQRG